MKLTLLLFTINFIIIMITISQKLIPIGGLLLIRAALVTIITSYLINSWYAFILFLIYVTGLLVLFGYFLALTPNTYQTSKKYFKSYLISRIPLWAIPVINRVNLPSFKLSFETDVISLITNFTMPIYWLIVTILLLLLLIVVSLTYKSPSPLRNFLKN